VFSKTRGPTLLSSKDFELCDIIDAIVTDPVTSQTITTTELDAAHRGPTIGTILCPTLARAHSPPRRPNYHQNASGYRRSSGCSLPCLSNTRDEPFKCRRTGRASLVLQLRRQLSSSIWVWRGLCHRACVRDVDRRSARE